MFYEVQVVQIVKVAQTEQAIQKFAHISFKKFIQSLQGFANLHYRTVVLVGE